MFSCKEQIIAKLQREILPLQGFKRSAANRRIGLGAIEDAFPGRVFPLGAVHEFMCRDIEAVTASVGFISGILGKLMHTNGVAVWISSAQQIFPPALRSFGIDPGQIIFMSLRDQKEILWALEEALKCTGLAAVIAEVNTLNFPISRRFQLAVEKSGVTGFIINSDERKSNTTACISRWQIASLPSILPENMPGVGLPCWEVKLLKARNGYPGSWQIEFYGDRFHYIDRKIPVVNVEQGKTG